MTLEFFKKALALSLVLIAVATVSAALGFRKGQAVAEYQHRAALAEAQSRIDQAVADANAATAQITHVYQDRVKVVKDVQVVVRDRIKEVERVVNAECTVPADAISILNAAAKGSL